MITEDYCSYEVSKLLNEKGFNGMCDTVIGRDDTKYDIKLYDYVEEETTSCPTHQMAMKWLREKGYHIVVFTDSPKYEVKIQDLNDGSFNVSGITHTYDTYEEAVEAAIKYCLTNLINNETN